MIIDGESKKVGGVKWEMTRFDWHKSERGYGVLLLDTAVPSTINTSTPSLPLVNYAAHRGAQASASEEFAKFLESSTEEIRFIAFREPKIPHNGRKVHHWGRSAAAQPP